MSLNTNERVQTAKWFFNVGCPFRWSEPTIVCSANHGQPPYSYLPMETLRDHVTWVHDPFYKDKGITGREEVRQKLLDLRQFRVLREALGYDKNFVSIYM